MKIKLIKEAGGIIIPRVKVSGPRGSLYVDLILDTGAAYTMISWDAATTIGYNPARRSKTLPIVTANGKIHVPLVSLRQISTQGTAVKNVPAICHDIPEIIEVSGLLGLSFLKHFRTTIDYRNRTLSIE